MITDHKRILLAFVADLALSVNFVFAFSKYFSFRTVSVVSWTLLFNRVADPLSFHPDPDPAF